jgi:enoyl-CoA hydratase/carnithine racemase
MDTNLFSIQSNDRVLTITFSHPPANVLSAEALTHLDHIVGQVERDKNHKVVILTTAGRFFCTGADIQEIKQIHSAKEGRDFSARGQQLLDRIEDLDKPVIAAIQGACLGGGLELAMACHLRLAANEASFGLPEITLGFIPGFGGTQRLPNLIGLAKGTEFILTGKTLSAEEAHTLGLINEVVPLPNLVTHANRLAHLIAEKGAPAIRAALGAIRSRRDLRANEGFTREGELFGSLCETFDAQEGLTAFLEKRPPRFRDE